MSDVIMVDTEQLDRCASMLKQAARGYADAASILASLNVGEEWWEKIKGFRAISLQDEGGSAPMGTARDTVTSLANVMRRYDSRMTELGKGVSNAAVLFNATENSLVARAKGQTAGESRDLSPVGGSAGATVSGGADAASDGDDELSDEEMIRFLEQSMVDAIRRQMANDYIQRWYDSLHMDRIAFAGGLYNIIQLKGEKFLMSDIDAARTLVDNILDRYATGGSDLLDKTGDYAGKAGDLLKNGTKAKDALDGAYALTTQSDVQRALYYMEKNNPSLSVEGSEGAKVLKGLKKLADAGKDIEAIAKAINRYEKMMNMDPAVARDLAKGMLASGDQSAIIAAGGLLSTNDPWTCLSYCVTSEGVDFLTDIAGDEARKAVDKAAMASPYAPIAVSKNVSTFATETAFNTSKTASAANYAESVNRMRGKTRDALKSAMAEYDRNPTSQNAEKVAQLYKTYNVQNAEQVNAVKKVSSKNDDSLMGRLLNGDKNEAARDRMSKIADGEIEKNDYVDEVQREIRDLKNGSNSSAVNDGYR